jgi:dCMP deaminase
MPRPTKDSYFLSMAELAAQRATCLRRAVGCVLVDGRGHVLATGYNGRPAGFPHCNRGVPGLGGLGLWETHPDACPGALAEPGEDLGGCEAVHAEQNALLQCSNVQEIHTAYVTVSPCLHCVKMLLNTACERIVFRTPYAHDKETGEMWRRKGRLWQHLPVNNEEN